MTFVPAFLLQDDTGAAVGLLAGGLLMTIIMFGIMAVVIAGIWKTFVKAGQPGWASIIPIYNLYVMTQIAGRPAWWIVLMCIPLVNIIVLALIAIDIAKAFGQSAAFGVVALFLFSAIGYLMLGFGSYQYIGSAGRAQGAAA